MTRTGPGDSLPAGRPARSLVLVAAADPQIGAVTAGILRAAGFEVVEANRAAAAAAVCRTRPGAVAAVLMDARMPDLDGPDALAAIRAADPSARCFVMSGNPGAYCWESLARAGAERMFARPFDTPTLLAALAEAVAGGADEEPRSDWPADREVRADGGA